MKKKHQLAPQTRKKRIQKPLAKISTTSAKVSPAEQLTYRPDNPPPKEPEPDLEPIERLEKLEVVLKSM